MEREVGEELSTSLFAIGRPVYQQSIWVIRKLVGSSEL